MTQGTGCTEVVFTYSAVQYSTVQSIPFQSSPVQSSIVQLDGSAGTIADEKGDENHRQDL